MSLEMRDVDEIRKDVREVMARKGISARQIYREAGIHPNTIASFLNERGQTYDQTIIKLCLHLSLQWYKSPLQVQEPELVA